MKLWWAATIGALVKRLNNYLNVVGDGSLSALQPGFCRAAGCCRKACLCTFGLAGRTQSCAPQARAGSCLLELNLINFTYIVTSVTPRNVSLKKEKLFLWWGSVGPKCWRRLGAVIPGSGGFSVPESCSFLNGVEVPQNWRQSGTFNSWEKKSDPHNPLFSFSCFLSRACQRTLKWPGF